MLWFNLDKGHGYMRTEHDERPFVARSRPWIGTVGRHVAVVCSSGGCARVGELATGPFGMPPGSDAAAGCA
jgi:hypothetical protein